MKRTPLGRGTSQLSRRTGLTTKKPLERSTPLPRSDTPPAPRKSPEGRSGGTGKATPIPPAVRAAVYERDDDRCARCGRSCGPGNRQIQHRRARGRFGYRDAHPMAALVLVCGFSATDPAGCHYAIESQPDWARHWGFRVPMDRDPEQWSYRRWDGAWIQLLNDGSATVVVPPFPDADQRS